MFVDAIIYINVNKIDSFIRCNYQILLNIYIPNYSVSSQTGDIAMLLSTANIFS